MNRALLFLWYSLLKRRVLHWGKALRRPTALIGFAAVASMIGFLFYFRREEIFGQLVRRESLIGGALVMLCGSLFKGFLQRGLVFEPPDIEFVFTSPFTQRQIVLYRLLPHYLFAVVQAVVFTGLFAPHLQHPLFVSGSLLLFQIACFHVATGAAIFAGTISEQLHHRIRWMMLVTFFLLTALYLRTAWEIRLVPAIFRSPLAQAVFFPAVTIPDVVASNWLHHILLGSSSVGTLLRQHVRPLLWLTFFGAAACMSLWALLRLRGNIFEASLATSSLRAQRRLLVRQGRHITVGALRRARSARLPAVAMFRGVRAIVWKNLVVARRSKREMAVALVFTLIYAGFLTALVWKFHQLESDANARSGSVADAHRTAMGFYSGAAAFIAMLAFFLQRMFPFDFRRDGHHLVAFRSLPFSPLALAVAEVAVPTAFVLACQAVGLLPLMYYARFDWPNALVLLLGFPAVALALNAVWNLHYLMAASRRAGGQGESASAVGTLMVVALSFLVFFPAAWVGGEVGVHLRLEPNTPVVAGSALAVQYVVDGLLILLLAKLFQRFEVSRDAS